jgi:SET domain-containing protein
MKKTTIRKSKIYDAGRGVFAKKNIKKGEIIERIEVIDLPKKDIKHIRKTKLLNYYYEFYNRAAIAL